MTCAAKVLSYSVPAYPVVLQTTLLSYRIIITTHKKIKISHW
jgi:hypothetical protein